MNDESLIEWASQWVRDEPEGQRQRFADGLCAELAARAERVRSAKEELLDIMKHTPPSAPDNGEKIRVSDGHVGACALRGFTSLAGVGR